MPATLTLRDLDEAIRLDLHIQVSFVRPLPLVGG